MGERLFSAFWVPVLAIVLTVVIVVVIGEVLLALADIRPEMGFLREPYAIFGALFLSAVILVGASLLSRVWSGCGQ